MSPLKVVIIIISTEPIIPTLSTLTPGVSSQLLVPLPTVSMATNKKSTTRSTTTSPAVTTKKIETDKGSCQSSLVYTVLYYVRLRMYMSRGRLALIT